jgi:hypothetical protein
MTTTSPVALLKPQASALPLPLRVCFRIRTSGLSDCATSTVPSVDHPSTTMSSLTEAGSAAKTAGRLAASLKVGMIALIRGELGRVSRGGLPHGTTDRDTRAPRRLAG